MPGGKGLSDAQNERLRKLIKERLLPKFGSQSALAPELGIEQGTLSAFLRGKHGGSFPLAIRAATLAKVDLSTIVGSMEEASGVAPHPPDRYANRAVVMDIGRRVGVSEAAIAEVESMDLKGDRPPMWWLRKLLNAQERLELDLPPGAEPGADPTKPPKP